MSEVEERDDALIAKVARMRSRILKDLYVLTMALTTLQRPGARTRALNAARRLDAAFREYE